MHGETVQLFPGYFQFQRHFAKRETGTVGGVRIYLSVRGKVQWLPSLPFAIWGFELNSERARSLGRWAPRIRLHDDRLRRYLLLHHHHHPHPADGMNERFPTDTATPQFDLRP